MNFSFHDHSSFVFLLPNKKNSSFLGLRKTCLKLAPKLRDVRAKKKKKVVFTLTSIVARLRSATIHHTAGVQQKIF